MKRNWQAILAGLTLAVLTIHITGVSNTSIATASDSDKIGKPITHLDKQIDKQAQRTIAEGRHTFRFDTFGDEAFWGDTIKLHQAIQGKRFGGVGSGLSPKAALKVGLKVDVDALPHHLIENLKHGRVDLDDPGITLALLKLNAVVGVTGIFESSGRLRSVGIQCALCHSMVDDSLAPGIGHRLDGWVNRDLNVGAIINLAPDLSAVAELLEIDERTVRKVFAAWGPGKFDAELLLDGKGFRPDGKTAATLIPPAFGLAGVNLHTWTGWGSGVREKFGNRLKGNRRVNAIPFAGRGPVVGILPPEIRRKRRQTCGSICPTAPLPRRCALP
jgi:hypothetical protein